MKEELKALYKKAPKLAQEAAAALGYKIVAQDNVSEENDVEGPGVKMKKIVMKYSPEGVTFEIPEALAKFLSVKIERALKMRKFEISDNGTLHILFK